MAKPELDSSKKCDPANDVGQSELSTIGKLHHWFARNPFKSSLLAGALLWLAMPPFNIWPLVFLALIPWISIISADFTVPKYLRKVWLASWCYWAATLYFIPIPHPAMWGGWFLLSLYCSIYIAASVGLSRVLIHRLKFSKWMAIPMVWVGLEFFRVNFMTGFGLALTGHSLYKVPLATQVADLCGAYTISFCVVLLSTFLWLGIADMKSRFSKLGCLAGAVLLLATWLGYGYYHLANSDSWAPEGSEGLSVGIIQGNIDTVFPSSEEEVQAILREKVEQYRELASSTKLHNADLDLVVWPEGKFIMDELLEQNPVGSVGGKQYQSVNRDDLSYFFQAMQSVEDYPMQIDQPDHIYNRSAIPSIVGTASIDEAANHKYNSALLFSSNGLVVQRYLKMQRVLIGEYIPLERQFPFLSSLSPSGQGLTAGDSPVSFQVQARRPTKGDRFRLCPSICFESCVPHLIRRQVAEFEGDQEHEIDFLVNLSDDGWFYGQSCLDFHLANTILRSIELRKPGIIAANTGISAFVDGNGCMLESGPRRDTAILIHELKQDRRRSFYLKVGDIVPFVFSLMGGLALAVAIWDRFKRRS